MNNDSSDMDKWVMFMNKSVSTFHDRTKMTHAKMFLSKIEKKYSNI